MIAFFNFLPSSLQTSPPPLFWPPRSLRSSQARDWIQVTVRTNLLSGRGLNMGPSTRDTANPTASQQELLCKCLLKKENVEFPGGLLVRTWWFHHYSPDSIPALGTETLQQAAARQDQKQ